MRLTRRAILKTGAAALAVPSLQNLAASSSALAQEAAASRVWKHGLSLYGDLKYPEGFKHFDYVNPSAPKGGVVRMIAIGTFDNFNPVVGGVKGTIAAGIELVTDTLFTTAMDEVAVGYGLLAEAVTFPPDYSSVTYRLRANAKWHDGVPVSVDDVLFSLNSFKTYHPFYSAYYRHVTKAEKTGEHEVTFTFDSPGNRELPQIVGEINILPKHWWEGTDKSGRKRDISATTLEPPLGAGAYRIKDFTPGRSVSYERVPDYWGKDLNVNIGRDNFAELRFEYFRDSTVAIEAFKADTIDWRTENSALSWNTAYDFPAIKDGRAIKEEFPVNSSGVMQGYVFNIRRPQFADPRVRRAFNCALNFEDLNKQFFFGQYKRITSYFDGLDLASSGLPQGDELAILETVRDKVPPEVFATPYSNPVNGTPEEIRANLREATRLLREAGYEVRNQKLINVKTSEPLTVEVLIDNPIWERIVLPYKGWLERLGIQMTLRRVDDAQYEQRLRNWDYDMIVATWGESLSPGNEQRNYWTSQAADQQGSRNYVGIKNPAVDALVDRVIFAKSRAELVAATKALDRVLLWNHYVVPQWTYGKLRSVRWDRFSRPETLPKYGNGAFPTVWWWDQAKASKVGSRT
ncbi:extracellular solute-binding protein [Rhodoplanes sp. Z2-YC6860]|uniref:extracellular solute-binding protein n=1 Tax=Rhodoplanes sp. Z2-YC6860 TaxID=674703 RepID=UPI00078D13F4|nr:extracellular solute-binding protein [Rhodoplanes sp. Z2-YC6860]AMN45130.1 oligopeptide ABC transporter substrate-binding protein [Rhodoplanes sp. Z2-YC6860]